MGIGQSLYRPFGLKRMTSPLTTLDGTPRRFIKQYSKNFLTMLKLIVKKRCKEGCHLWRHTWQHWHEMGGNNLLYQRADTRKMTWYTKAPHVDFIIMLSSHTLPRVVRILFQVLVASYVFWKRTKFFHVSQIVSNFNFIIFILEKNLERVSIWHRMQWCLSWWKTNQRGMSQEKISPFYSSCYNDNTISP